MEKRIATSFVLTILLSVAVSPLNASAITDSAGFENFNFQIRNGTPASQDHSTSSAPPPTQWNRTYGGAEADRAYSVLETSDGGYAIAGATGSFGAGNYDFWLVKTDSTGNPQWNRTYGGTDNDIARSLVKTGDTEYAIAGYTASYGAGGDDLWLVKVGAEVHDVAVTSVVPSKTVVGQGYALHINVTVANQGTYTETFNVTAYATTTIIDTKTVTLENGNSAIVTFAWDTTGVAYGNYTISAVADTTSSETDTADNTYTHTPNVTVTIPGDVNGDRTVDILDAGEVSSHWYPGPPKGPLGYDANVDINNDGRIDLTEAAIVNADWHQSW